MPSVIAMNAKKNTIAIDVRLADPRRTGAPPAPARGRTSIDMTVMRSAPPPHGFEPGVVVRVRPSHVDPRQHPRQHDHERAEQHADAETARQRAAHERLVVRDEKDEPK
jgi:hypothetical protein